MRIVSIVVAGLMAAGCTTPAGTSSSSSSGSSNGGAGSSSSGMASGSGGSSASTTSSSSAASSAAGSSSSSAAASSSSSSAASSLSSSSGGGADGGVGDAGVPVVVPGATLLVGVGNWGLRGWTADGAQWNYCGNMSTGNDHSPDLLRNIAYGDGVFIAVGGDANGMVMRSLDGVHWQEDLLPTNACPGEPYPSPCTNWQGAVVYVGNGVWVAGGGNGSLMRSADHGLTWAGLHPNPGVNAVRSLVAAGGLIVAGTDQGVVSVSPDQGDSFSSTTLWQYSMAVAAGGGQFMAWGRHWNGGGFDAACFVSTDNTQTWNPCAAEIDGVENLVHDGSQWVALISSGYATSTNGTTWQTHATSTFPSFFAYDGARWWGVGGGRAWTATNLDAWQSVAMGVPDFRAATLGRVLEENLPVTGVPVCVDNR